MMIQTQANGVLMHCLVLKLLKEQKAVFSAEPTDEAFFGSLKYWIEDLPKVKNTAFKVQSLFDCVVLHT